MKSSMLKVTLAALALVTVLGGCDPDPKPKEVQGSTPVIDLEPLRSDIKKLDNGLGGQGKNLLDQGKRIAALEIAGAQDRSDIKRLQETVPVYKQIVTDLQQAVLDLQAAKSNSLPAVTTDYQDRWRQEKLQAQMQASEALSRIVGNSRLATDYLVHALLAAQHDHTSWAKATTLLSQVADTKSELSHSGKLGEFQPEENKTSYPAVLKSALWGAGAEHFKRTFAEHRQIIQLFTPKSWVEALKSERGLLEDKRNWEKLLPLFGNWYDGDCRFSDRRLTDEGEENCKGIAVKFTTIFGRSLSVEGMSLVGFLGRRQVEGGNALVEAFQEAMLTLIN